MSLIQCAHDARRDEARARLTRAIALRALHLSGVTQSDIADQLGISQPAVSQILKSAERVEHEHPADLIAAATPVLKQIAADRGFTELAVFGSVATGKARRDSDIDLLVRAPEACTISDIVELSDRLTEILGRHVDVITYGALKDSIDDDIRRDAVLL
jgi:predicted nucleotidyltransferase